MTMKNSRKLFHGPRVLKARDQTQAIEIPMAKAKVNSKKNIPPPE
jgi:hypothetical protein